MSMNFSVYKREMQDFYVNQISTIIIRVVDRGSFSF